MKYEWESESKKNEGNINALKDKIKKQFEDHKKLKSEISHFETYASSLESDLADSVSEKVKLEHEVIISQCLFYFILSTQIILKMNF